MNNTRVSSVSWISISARDAWANVIRSLNEACIGSILGGVHEQKWTHRSLKLSGYEWGTFLAMAKKFNVAYTTEVLPEVSNPNRECRYVLVTNPSNADTGPAPAMFSQKARAQHRFWDIAQGTGAPIHKDEFLIDCHPTFLSILFWQDLGISLFAEAPEGLDSDPHFHLLADHFSWMDCAGFKTEASSMKQILSWPLEWTSLHGIEEIHTPLFKMSISNWSDIRHQKHTIRVQGNGYPEEGIDGLAFPYRMRNKKAVTDSHSFRKGLAHNRGLICKP